MCGAWLLCFLLTIFEVFPSTPEEYGFLARTDINIHAVTDSPWFYVPYPGRFTGMNMFCFRLCKSSNLAAFQLDFT